MEHSAFHVRFTGRNGKPILPVFLLRSSITGMKSRKSFILSTIPIWSISTWSKRVSKVPAFVLLTVENCMHLPPILTSIENRLSSSLPICSHSLLRTRRRNSFCFHYRNISFPFRLFLRLITRHFRTYSRNFSGSAQSSSGKIAAVQISLQPKIPFHSCGSRLHF